MRYFLKPLLFLLVLYFPLEAREAKKKVCFIVNPVSGVGKQKRIKKLIKRNLDRKRFSYEIIYTKRPKHATELSRKAVAEGAHIIVAVGGGWLGE